MRLVLILLCTSLITNANNGSIKLKETPSKRLKIRNIHKASGVIWSFVFINSNELLYTIRSGELIHLNLKTKKKTSLPTPNVHAKGQGGLLDVQYYQVQGKDYVYVTFSEKVKDVVTTSLARAVVKKDEKSLSLSKWEVIFRANVKSDTSVHFGSRLVREDNYIYMGVGDRGERDLAQNKSLHNGSILRLTMDGKPTLWSYGHRNPQGIDIDPVTGNLYNCEFGPRGGDELNHVKKDKNYGWPIITYGSEYWGPKIGATHSDGMEQPIMYWTPSISPSGMAFYTGNKNKKWKNNLFLANLSSRHLRRLVLKDNKVIKQEVLLKDLKERIRHVRNGADGHLYVSTDSGKIIRVSLKKRIPHPKKRDFIYKRFKLLNQMNQLKWGNLEKDKFFMHFFDSSPELISKVYQQFDRSSIQDLYRYIEKEL
jgi:aldose sugar dehydrogenase